jgi:hypothetical protein
MTKTLFRSLPVLALAAAVSTSALAQTEHSQHEITGGTSSSLRFGGDRTHIDLGVGYRNMLLPESGIQVGGDFSFSLTDAGASTTTTWDIVPAIRYNIDGVDGLRRSFFVDLVFGLSIADTNVTEAATSFVFGGGIGRRFELATNVTWTPRVLVRKVENSDVDFTITPLAFSLFF